jgi:hypothetical protein
MQQPLPTIATPWEESVQYLLCMTVATGRRAWMAQHIKARADEGHATYGTYLGVGNPGRDGDRDLQEELFDSMVYAFERYMDTQDSRYWAAVLRLAFTLDELYGLGR